MTTNAERWRLEYAESQKMAIDLETRIAILKDHNPLTDEARAERAKRIRQLQKQLREAERHAINCLMMAADHPEFTR